MFISWFDGVMFSVFISLTWVSSYLHNGEQYEINQVTSKLIPIKFGVTQGFVLGPV